MVARRRRRTSRWVFGHVQRAYIQFQCVYTKGDTVGTTDILITRSHNTVLRKSLKYRCNHYDQSFASLKYHSQSQIQWVNWTFCTTWKGLPAYISPSSSTTRLRTWYVPERAIIPDGDSSGSKFLIYGSSLGDGPYDPSICSILSTG